MTADGDRADEPVAPDWAARENATSFSTLLLRQALANEDAFWTAIESREQELRDLMEDSASNPQEQRAARADLASLAWLTDVWDAVQHNARCLKNFDHWLQTPPGRKKLFAEFCRHAVPAEWDRYVSDKSLPFIFRSPQEFQLHMEHCQLCDAQRQLADGRRLRSDPVRPTWADRLVREFLTTFCGDALSAVCNPAPQRSAGLLESFLWSEAPPLRLVAPSGARLKVRSEFEIEIPARLIGPERPGRFELLVTAQHIDSATRQPEPPREVWPPRSGGEEVLDWRPTPQGWREFPLVLPAPAEPGRMILRYAVRTAPLATGAAYSAQPEPTKVDALVFDFSRRLGE